MRNQRFVQYHQRILELDPIAYWVQDEKTRLVSYDWARRRQGSDQDGAYTGTTPGQPGVGDGRTSQFFDGVNDFNNIYTAIFAGRFNGSEGSILAWARVANAGVWIDGAARTILSLGADANNTLNILKLNAPNNTMRWRYVAGAVTQGQTFGTSTEDWFHISMTWSSSLDEVRMFFNGIQIGIHNGLGVWVGLLVNTTSVVGALNTAPGNVWHGDEAHAALFDRALTAAEVAELAVL